MIVNKKLLAENLINLLSSAISTRAADNYMSLVNSKYQYIDQLISDLIVIYLDVSDKWELHSSYNKLFLHQHLYIFIEKRIPFYCGKKDTGKAVIVELKDPRTSELYVTYLERSKWKEIKQDYPKNGDSFVQMLKNTNALIPLDIYQEMEG
jgi:hypothetical protein